MRGFSCGPTCPESFRENQGTPFHKTKTSHQNERFFLWAHLPRKLSGEPGNTFSQNKKPPIKMRGFSNVGPPAPKSFGRTREHLFTKQKTSHQNERFFLWAHLPRKLSGEPGNTFSQNKKPPIKMRGFSNVGPPAPKSFGRTREHLFTKQKTSHQNERFF